MPTEPDDQIRATTYGVLNGSLTQMTAATVKSTHPTGSVYIFSQATTFHFQNKPLSFRQGAPVHLDPVLKAALLAAGAPMTAA